MPSKCYFKAAEGILAPIASTRVVALNREFGLPALRTAHLGSIPLCAASSNNRPKNDRSTSPVQDHGAVVEFR